MPSSTHHPLAVARLTALFAATALSGCLQPNLLFDPIVEGSSSSTDPGDDPTTPTDGGGEPDTGSSTDASTTGGSTGSTGELDPASGGDGSSGGTTEGMQFPTCSFEPPGVEIVVSLGIDGATQDETLRPCGAAETWSPMLGAGYDGAAHHFQRCVDDLCGDCDPMDRLELGMVVPDPFAGIAAALVAGSCTRVQVTWGRPVPGDEMLCRPSMVALVELRDGALEPVPAVLYRHTASLPASDAVGEFALAAAPAGPGAIECACEGDCCREQPGSRRVDFTIAMAGDVTDIPTLESQESTQDIALAAVEGPAETGDLALVRAHFPEVCAEPAQYEWLFGRTTPAP